MGDILAAWRRRAQQIFPERAPAIKQIRTVVELVDSLVNDLRVADPAIVGQLGDRFVDFVKPLLTRSASAASRTRVVEALVHLGSSPNTRGLLPRLIPPLEFPDVGEEFRRWLEADDFEQVLAEYAVVRLCGE
jgi:hypothetical protein